MVTVYFIGANTTLATLATFGNECSAKELYYRAKSRLFAALYGSGDSTEALAILHSLQKKAFGIWSPFQMEDFLHYPVSPNAEQEAAEFTENLEEFQAVRHRLRGISELANNFLEERIGVANFKAYKRQSRDSAGT